MLPVKNHGSLIYKNLELYRKSIFRSGILRPKPKLDQKNSYLNKEPFTLAKGQ